MLQTASLFCSFCTTHGKHIKFRFLSNRLSLIYLRKKKTSVKYRSQYFKELGCSWQKVKYSQAGFSRFVLWVRRAKWKQQTLVHGLLLMVGCCRALRLRDNKRVALTMIHPSIIHTVYPCSVAQEDWSQSQLTGNSLDRSQVTHGWHIETNKHSRSRQSQVNPIHLLYPHSKARSPRASCREARALTTTPLCSGSCTDTFSAPQKMHQESIQNQTLRAL